MVSQIAFITLVLQVHTVAVPFMSDCKLKLCRYVEPKPFSCAKSTCFDCAASHTEHPWRCSYACLPDCPSSYWTGTLLNPNLIRHLPCWCEVGNLTLVPFLFVFTFYYGVLSSHGGYSFVNK
jgi:hypothetical protein